MAKYKTDKIEIKPIVRPLKGCIVSCSSFDQDINDIAAQYLNAKVETFARFHNGHWLVWVLIQEGVNSEFVFKRGDNE